MYNIKLSGYGWIIRFYYINLYIKLLLLLLFQMANKLDFNKILTGKNQIKI